MMMTVPRIIETGLILMGAEEYWAYQGLKDSYYDLADTPEIVMNSFPDLKFELIDRSKEVYLLGFYLGLEIKGKLDA